MKSCNDKIRITLWDYYPEERLVFSGFLIRRNGKEGILDDYEKSLLSCDYDNIVIVQYAKRLHEAAGVVGYLNAKHAVY